MLLFNSWSNHCGIMGIAEYSTIRYTNIYDSVSQIHPVAEKSVSRMQYQIIIWDHTHFLRLRRKRIEIYKSKAISNLVWFQNMSICILSAHLSKFDETDYTWICWNIHIAWHSLICFPVGIQPLGHPIMSIPRGDKTGAYMPNVQIWKCAIPILLSGK